MSLSGLQKSVFTKVEWATFAPQAIVCLPAAVDHWNIMGALKTTEVWILSQIWTIIFL